MAKHRSSRRKHRDLNIIWDEGKHSMAAESYRTLRTNISLSQVDNPLRTLTRDKLHPS